MESNNIYRVNWNGHPQPLGSNDFHSAKMYILHSLAQGGCTIGQFQIFDNWGELKTNIIYDKNADPLLTINYKRIFS